MSDQHETLVPLQAALRDLVAWFEDTHVSGMVIGGVAASLLGRPRVTRDIDALVILDEREWANFLAQGIAYHFLPRISDAIVFAQRARVLLVRHQTSWIDVDIAFGLFPFEREAVAQAMTHEVGGIRVPLPLPEDLIIMKAIAHRPRDMVDIEAIVAAQPNVNLQRVRRLLGELATALEKPQLVRDFNALITRQGRRKKQR